MVDAPAPVCDPAVGKSTVPPALIVTVPPVLLKVPAVKFLETFRVPEFVKLEFPADLVMGPPLTLKVPLFVTLLPFLTSRVAPWSTVAVPRLFMVAPLSKGSVLVDMVSVALALFFSTTVGLVMVPPLQTNVPAALVKTGFCVCALLRSIVPPATVDVKPAAPTVRLRSNHINPVYPALIVMVLTVPPNWAPLSTMELSLETAGSKVTSSPKAGTPTGFQLPWADQKLLAPGAGAHV